MKLKPDKLTPTPESFDFEGSEEWWNRHRVSTSEGAYQVIEPFRFALEAYTMGEDIHLSGTMAGVLDVECSRCLARYRHALREAFRLILEPSRGRTPPDPEGSRSLVEAGLWLGDELESGWYQGNVIQLDGFFVELVSLALPVQPLCREDCAGLCPTCGENRNQVDCGCEERRPDSPFAALAALRGERGDI